MGRRDDGFTVERFAIGRKFLWAAGRFAHLIPEKSEPGANPWKSIWSRRFGGRKERRLTPLACNKAHYPRAENLAQKPEYIIFIMRTERFGQIKCRVIPRLPRQVFVKPLAVIVVIGCNDLEFNGLC
jgi:hypothetical protein